MIKPIVRWAGGKSKLVNRILKDFPFSYDDEFTFYEPFGGGMAVSLFILQHYPKAKVIVSDINKNLIDLYTSIKLDVNLVAKHVNDISFEFLSLANRDQRKAFYYDIRDEYNKIQSGFTKSVLFLFLNKVGFNGLYRENSKGDYNVPCGDLPEKWFIKYAETKQNTIINIPNLLKFGQLLADRYVKLLLVDIVQTASIPDADIYYFDPPYYGTFNDYNKNKFNVESHLRLVGIMKYIIDAGKYVIVNNSVTDIIVDTYTDIGLNVDMVDFDVNISGLDKGNKKKRYGLLGKNF